VTQRRAQCIARDRGGWMALCRTLLRQALLHQALACRVLPRWPLLQPAWYARGADLGCDPASPPS
jgi:hypothetical protein